MPKGNAPIAQPQSSDEILRAFGIRDKPKTVKQICQAFDVTRSMLYVLFVDWLHDEWPKQREARR